MPRPLPPVLRPPAVLALAALVACAAPAQSGAGADAVAPEPAAERGTPAVAAPAAGIEVVAVLELPTGHRAAGTELGGLSALAYEPASGLFFALSDDRGGDPERGPSRLYALRFVPGADGAPLGGVEVESVTVLSRDGAPLPAGRVDPEGLALDGDGFWIASEGVASAGVPPFVNRFGRDGAERAALPVPERYLPGGMAGARRGVRDNLGFEALALAPGGRRLIAGTESALHQDGPEADHERPAAARLAVWDLAAGAAVAEHLYPVDPVPWPPAVPGAFRVSGLTALAALGERRLLALERAYAADRGTALKLYLVDLAAAADVSEVESLTGAAAPPRPAAKELLLDFGAALEGRGVALDNFEGMAFGPDLPDGRRLLVLVADNNFDPGQRTVFAALAVPREVLE